MYRFSCVVFLGLTFVTGFSFAQTEEMDFLLQFVSNDADIYPGVLPPFGFLAPLPEGSQLIVSSHAEIAGSSVFVKVQGDIRAALEDYDKQLQTLGWQRFDRSENVTYCKDAGYGVLVKGLENSDGSTYLMLQDSGFSVGQFCFYKFEK